MNGELHISQEDLALYSLQALSPTEAAEIESHLNGCAQCRAQLAESLADVSLIGMSAPPQAVPAGARQRFMAAVQNTPQSTASAATTQKLTPRPSPQPERKSAIGWAGWLGWAVAVAAIIAAVVLGVRDGSLQSNLNSAGGQIAQLSAQAARAQQLMNDLTSPQAQQVTLTETKHPAHPVGHATYLWNSGTLVFVASNMHPVPAGKTYELWLIPADGKAPMPAGLFRPDASGNASVVMPPLPAGVKAKAFGVTIEQAQGSPTPTLPIVMAGG